MSQLEEIDYLFSAEHWDRPLTALERFRLEHTAREIPRDGGSLLDVGCGDGRLLALLVRRGGLGELVGCDASRAGLERVSVPTVMCDATQLPFDDDSFDHVTCCELLEHLDDGQLQRVTSELRRVARRHVYITVPRHEDLERGMARCRACDHRFHIHGHRQSFDSGRLGRLFPGWVVERCGSFGAGRTRDLHPRLLKIKQDTFDCWAWPPERQCPSCSAPLTAGDRRIVRWAIGAANVVARPRRDAGGWLYCLLTAG